MRAIERIRMTASTAQDRTELLCDDRDAGLLQESMSPQPDINHLAFAFIGPIPLAANFISWPVQPVFRGGGPAGHQKGTSDLVSQAFRFRGMNGRQLIDFIGGFSQFVSA